jgi:hypothetical protein
MKKKFKLRSLPLMLLVLSSPISFAYPYNNTTNTSDFSGTTTIIQQDNNQCNIDLNYDLNSKYLAIYDTTTDKVKNCVFSLNTLKYAVAGAIGVPMSLGVVGFSLERVSGESTEKGLKAILSKVGGMFLKKGTLVFGGVIGAAVSGGEAVVNCIDQYQQEVLNANVKDYQTIFQDLINNLEENYQKAQQCYNIKDQKLEELIGELKNMLITGGKVGDFLKVYQEAKQRLMELIYFNLHYNLKVDTKKIRELEGLILSGQINDQVIQEIANLNEQEKQILLSNKKIIQKLEEAFPTLSQYSQEVLKQLFQETQIQDIDPTIAIAYYDIINVLKKYQSIIPNYDLLMKQLKNEGTPESKEDLENIKQEILNFLINNMASYGYIEPLKELLNKKNWNYKDLDNALKQIKKKLTISLIIKDLDSYLNDLKTYMDALAKFSYYSDRLKDYYEELNRIYKILETYRGVKLTASDFQKIENLVQEVDDIKSNVADLVKAIVLEKKLITTHLTLKNIRKIEDKNSILKGEIQEEYKVEIKDPNIPILLAGKELLIMTHPVKPSIRVESQIPFILSEVDNQVKIYLSFPEKYNKKIVDGSTFDIIYVDTIGHSVKDYSLKLGLKSTGSEVTIKVDAVLNDEYKNITGMVLFNIPLKVEKSTDTYILLNGKLVVPINELPLTVKVRDPNIYYTYSSSRREGLYSEQLGVYNVKNVKYTIYNGEKISFDKVPLPIQIDQEATYVYVYDEYGNLLKVFKPEELVGTQLTVPVVVDVGKTNYLVVEILQTLQQKMYESIQRLTEKQKQIEKYIQELSQYEDVSKYKEDLGKLKSLISQLRSAMEINDYRTFNMYLQQANALANDLLNQILDELADKKGKLNVANELIDNIKNTLEYLENYLTSSEKLFEYDGQEGLKLYQSLLSQINKYKEEVQALEFNSDNIDEYYKEAKKLNVEVNDGLKIKIESQIKVRLFMVLNTINAKIESLYSKLKEIAQYDPDFTTYLNNIEKIKNIIEKVLTNKDLSINDKLSLVEDLISNSGILESKIIQNINSKISELDTQVGMNIDELNKKIQEYEKDINYLSKIGSFNKDLEKLKDEVYQMKTKLKVAEDYYQKASNAKDVLTKYLYLLKAKQITVELGNKRLEIDYLVNELKVLLKQEIEKKLKKIDSYLAVMASQENVDPQVIQELSNYKQKLQQLKQELESTDDPAELYSIKLKLDSINVDSIQPITVQSSTKISFILLAITILVILGGLIFRFRNDLKNLIFKKKSKEKENIENKNNQF